MILLALLAWECCMKLRLGEGGADAAIAFWVDWGGVSTTLTLWDDNGAGVDTSVSLLDDESSVAASVTLDDDRDDAVAAVALALWHDGGGGVGAPRKIGFILLEETELSLANTRRKQRANDNVEAFIVLNNKVRTQLRFYTHELSIELQCQSLYVSSNLRKQQIHLIQSVSEKTQTSKNIGK